MDEEECQECAAEFAERATFWDREEELLHEAVWVAESLNPDKVDHETE